MKKSGKVVAAVLCAVLCGAVFTACNDAGDGKCTLLRESAIAEYLSYTERENEGYLEISAAAEEFATRFAEAAYSEYDGIGKFAVSPVSVYMALALAAECASGETREELLSALGVSYEHLQSDFAYLYRSLEREFKTGEVAVGNSVWVNEGTEVNGGCLDALAEKYFCDSYSADFAGDNEQANLAVRSFVRRLTGGLIDKDFELSPETLFTLVNVLYLKDAWHSSGDDLSFTDSEISFTEQSGNVKTRRFLEGDYLLGRACETDTFASFYVRTAYGYKMKFILPKDGYTAAEVFTAENIALANSVGDYGGTDNVNRVRYFTRCVFPEFGAAYDNDVKGILSEYFGVNKLFSKGECELGSLLSDNNATAFCSKVRHVTKLTVDRKGIEGAAATIIDAPTASDPGDYKEVYLDFVVDKAFGFVLTDSCDTTMFAGVIGGI